MRCLSVESPSGNSRSDDWGGVGGVLLPHGDPPGDADPLLIFLPALTYFPGFGGEGGEPVGEVVGDPGEVLSPPVVPPVIQEDHGKQNKEEHLDAQPVPLYDGNQYHIYIYHVYDDVRLVFAPAKQVAFYGGDYDNFTYPRWCLDCAFFRVYEDDKPIDSSKWFFKFEPKGAKTDDLVFVSGHPGGTERSLTYAEMVMHRDLWVPEGVKLLANSCKIMKARMEESGRLQAELEATRAKELMAEGHQANNSGPIGTQCGQPGGPRVTGRSQFPVYLYILLRYCPNIIYRPLH